MRLSGEQESELLPILDSAFKADPYPFYAALRKLGGITRMQLPSGAQVWIISRYCYARKLLADPRLSKIPMAKDRTAPTHALFNHLLTMDPPLHTALRKLLAPHFSSHRLRAFEPRMAVIAEAILSAIPHDGEPFDALAAFAVPLAQSGVCELVGVPDEVRGSISRGLDDLDHADLDAPERVPLIVQHLFNTLMTVTDQHCGLLPESLLAMLCVANKEGSISREQVVALVYLVLAAGRETTSNLIVNGVLRLLTQPQGWSELVRAQQCTAQLLEELLRLESPLEMATARYASVDIGINGTTIRAGDTVFVSLAASNRDPFVYDRPDEFDVSRSETNKHLAFGYGIHRCIGATFARIEARIALERLAAHFPSLQLAVPANQLIWKPGLISRGLQNLPVRSGTISGCINVLLSPCTG